VVTDIEPVIWLKKPDSVEKLINPIVLMMLIKRFTKSGFSVVEWLINTAYSPAHKTPDKILGKLISSGVERGYNNFVTNFDIIMETLFSITEFAPKSQKYEKRADGKIDYLKQLLYDFKTTVFSEYLPLPNKAVLIFDTQHLGTYADPSVMTAVDAINTMVSIDRDFYDQSTKTKQNRTAKAMVMLCDYYDETLKLMAHKQGHFRRHMYGSRTNFSFRAVITSVTAGSNYDEIEAPWCMGVTAFRLHMLNKLQKHGLGLNESIGFLYKHTNKYHKLLERFMKEMVNESPDKGIWVILQRNPSLLQGSAQRVRITKFKTNPQDQTIGMNILTVKAPNADFDGDALNISISLDKKMSDMWYPLAPEFNIFQMTQPFQASGNISIPKPNIATISSWLEG
jgi:hypothetical protein